LIPPASGRYILALESSEGVRLTINGVVLIDDLAKHEQYNYHREIEMRANVPQAIVLDFYKSSGAVRCRLSWIIPEDADAPDPEALLECARRDGTTLLIIDRAETWMDLLQKRSCVRYDGSFAVGSAWLGGGFFVKKHSLFGGLPVDAGMSWPYQAVVRNGADRLGLKLQGEELVAGCYHSYPMQLGTAVGVIRCGRGSIIVSTLDICNNLDISDSSANVAKKLLCNFIQYAMNRTATA
jgi:beta-galactosidase